MVRFPEYSNPGIYLSSKHNSPSWSKCPGSNTNPCPLCGSLWLSPPYELKNPTTGYCLDSNCNCCAKVPDSLLNKDLSSCQPYAKGEQRNGQHNGKRDDCSPCFNFENTGQHNAPSKSTQCNVENPVGNPESDCRGYCQVSCVQPYYQSEVSLPYSENQTYAVCVSNTMNPPHHSVNTCYKFCPVHDQYALCPCMGINCPFHRRPSCPFCLNPSCGNYCVPTTNDICQSSRSDKPTTCDKAVLCKPEDFIVLIGGKFQGRGRDMRNGLQDRL
ncbi:hypothetical protein WA026_022569 [Henosepilachna vigintioctopunctata]|uniref:Uncharacterized protein n=1 Tax=Henosepilachna vigintioctopunctata TaxID=420089 RepID=A0AAW1VGE4_9CUCU